MALAAALLIASAAVACSGDDPQRAPDAAGEQADAAQQGADADTPGVESCDPDDLASLTSNEVSDGGTVETGCYLVEGDLVIASGVLEIEPGTEIYFAEGSSLTARLDGALNAEGTEEASILFTSLNAGTPEYWKGLRYEGSSSANNILDFVIVEFGGSEAFGCTDPANVSLDQRGGETAGVTIRNSILRDGAGFGLCSLEGADLAGFARTTVTGNEQAALFVDGSNMADFPGDEADANDFRGNGADHVLVRGGTYDSEIARGATATATIAALNVPYRILDRVKVDDGTVAIQPGTTLEMDEGVEFHIGSEGALTAIGTEEERIVFTSADPSLPTHWQRMYFWGTNSAANVLEYVDIEYGGKGAPGDETGALYLEQKSGSDPSVALRNATIGNSQRYGIWFEDGGLTDCDEVTFESNGDGDLGGDASTAGCF